MYIPLGGNRVSIAKNIRNILIVWFLTGFWHGASWNFIVWGMYYGVLLLAEKFLLRDLKKKLPAVVNVAMTFVLVLIGWVFFYYEDLSVGLHHLGVMFGLSDAALCDPHTVYYFKHNLVFLVTAALASCPWKQLLQKLPERNTLCTAGNWLKPLVATALFLLAMAMVVTQSYNPFLYFRF